MPLNVARRFALAGLKTCLKLGWPSAFRAQHIMAIAI